MRLFENGTLESAVPLKTEFCDCNSDDGFGDKIGTIGKVHSMMMCAPLCSFIMLSSWRGVGIL